MTIKIEINGLGIVSNARPYDLPLNKTPQKTEISQFIYFILEINGCLNVRSLECLNHLECLNLEKIRIDRISLYSLSNLRKLTLSNLQTMSHLSWKAYGDAFKDLINLEYLKCVSEQQETQFSFNLDHLSNLKWLQIESFEIDQNLISSIKSQKICVLKISNCRSKEKIFIEKISSLRVLDFSCFVNLNWRQT